MTPTQVFVPVSCLPWWSADLGYDTSQVVRVSHGLSSSFGDVEAHPCPGREDNDLRCCLSAWCWPIAFGMRQTTKSATSRRT